MLTHNDQFLNFVFKDSVELKLIDFQNYKIKQVIYLHQDLDNDSLSITMYNAHKYTNPANPIEYFAFKLPIMEKGSTQTQSEFAGNL